MIIWRSSEDHLLGYSRPWNIGLGSTDTRQILVRYSSDTSPIITVISRVPYSSLNISMPSTIYIILWMEDGTGEHTPQHFLNSYSLSSYMSHIYLKLLTLCPYELFKMLTMFISIKFEHRVLVYQQCIWLHVNPLLRRLYFYWCLSFHLLAALLKNLFMDFNGFLHILILLFFLYSYIMYCFGVCFIIGLIQWKFSKGQHQKYNPRTVN